MRNQIIIFVLFLVSYETFAQISMDDLNPTGTKIELDNKNERNADYEWNDLQEKQTPDFSKRNISAANTNCSNPVTNDVEALKFAQKDIGSDRPSACGELYEGYRAALGSVRDFVIEKNGDSSSDDVKAFTNPGVECKYTDYALDYHACAQLMNRYNIAFVSENVVLEPGVQISQANAQRESTRMVANQNNIQTTAIDATKNVVDNQKNNELAKGAFYAANAGQISGGLAAWPTVKWLNKSEEGEKCYEKLGFSEACEYLYKMITVDTKYKKLLFPNSDAKGFFMGQLAQYAGKAAVSGFLADAYDKQGNLLDKAKQDTLDLQGDIAELPKFKNCADSPEMAGCNLESNTASYGAVGNGGLQFGGAGANSAFNPASLDNSGDSAIAKKISDSEQATIAAGLANLDPKSVGVGDTAPSAAFYEGGKGGGGAGGSSAPGGAGGSAGSAQLSDTPGMESQKNEQKDLEVGRTQVSYSNGGGGKRNGGGSSSRGSENPFAGLLNPNNLKKTGGIEIDRALAAKEIDSGNSVLFEKISKRYGKVLGEKRLVEYQETK